MIPLPLDKFNQKGLSTIVIVLFISAISLVLVLGVSFLTLGDLDISNDYQYHKKSLYLADACLDDTLIRVERNNNLYLSNYSLSILDGLCIIDVDGDANNKDIKIKANFDSYYQNIEASFNIGSKKLDVLYK